MNKRSILILVIFIIGCASRTSLAPIENITKLPTYLSTNSNVAPLNNVEPSEQNNAPTAKMGTLDSDNIVTTNNVDSSTHAPYTPAVTATPTDNLKDVIPSLNHSSKWTMPTKGRASDYNPSDKGIDIYGNPGQQIYAARDGKVVYSGNGLKGYGNLVIIKHDESYLTAYSKNQHLLVNEGQLVKLGQPIATMGKDDSAKGILHFELRFHGKPINPYKTISNN